jgi:hypothetical protein
MPLNSQINVTANANDFIGLTAELGSKIGLNATLSASLSATSNINLLVTLHENYVATTTTTPIVGLNANGGDVYFTISGEPIVRAHYILTTDRTLITVDRTTITTDQPSV